MCLYSLLFFAFLSLRLVAKIYLGMRPPLVVDVIIHGGRKANSSAVIVEKAEMVLLTFSERGYMLESGNPFTQQT